MRPNAHRSSTSCIALVLLLLTLAIPRASAAPGQPITEPRGAVLIELEPGAVIHGGERQANLTVQGGDTLFDLNGDGRQDFLARYVTKAHHPTLRQDHIDVVFGRETWPAETDIADLDDRLAIQLPNPADVMPNDPDYSFRDIIDVAGGPEADILVQKQQWGRNYQLRSTEMMIFFGRPNWEETLEVAETEPDLRIVQPNPPRNDRERERVPLPDTIAGGDYNGDGQRDLAICSYTLKPDINEEQGAVLLYFGPYAQEGELDLSERPPDASIYTSKDTSIRCPYQAVDYNGDGIDDLFAYGWQRRNMEQFTHGNLILGRREWPATSWTQELAGQRVESLDTDGSLSFVLWPMNDDPTDDLVGRARVFSKHDWSDPVTCVWFTGPSLGANLDTEHCDLRFPERWPQLARDINGDGARDYFFGMDQENREPYEWRIGLGPIARGGEMLITEDEDSGDHVLRFDYRSDGMNWLLADVGGPSEDADLIVMDYQSNESAPDAGRIEIHFGPLVEPPPPTPVPTTPVPTPEPPTAVPTTPVPTPEPPTAVPTTPVPPTAVPTTPVPPTEVPEPERIYLPRCLNQPQP